MATGDQLAQLDSELAEEDEFDPATGTDVPHFTSLDTSSDFGRLFETEHDVPQSEGGDKVRLDLHPELAKIAPHLVCAVTCGPALTTEQFGVGVAVGIAIFVDRQHSKSHRWGWAWHGHQYWSAGRSGCCPGGTTGMLLHRCWCSAWQLWVYVPRDVSCQVSMWH